MPEHGFLKWLGVNCSMIRAGLIRERAKLLGESKLTAEAAPDQPSGSLSSKDDVLKILQKEHPCRLVLPDLVAKAEIARKTCVQIVNSLIERRLAERQSERTGVAITPAGQALLRDPGPPKGPLISP